MAATSTPDLDRRLDVVESKLAVMAIVHTCAFTNDRRDMEGLLACFWPEATANYGAYDGSARGFYEGYARPIIEGCLFAAHHISNVTVEVDGDRALSQSYYFAHHRRRAAEGGGEEDAFFEGRYVDLFERRAGVWKIIRRRGFMDHTAVTPALIAYADWPAGRHSQPWPDDESYRIAAEFRAAART